MVDYKVIYLKLKQRYPEIARELEPDQMPVMDPFEMLKAFTLFCKARGIIGLYIPDNRTEIRDLFIAVFVRLYDPEYFLCRKKLRKGLRPKIAYFLNCSESIISYNLANVKNYLSIYREFSNEVDNIYNKIKSELHGNQEKTAQKKEETRL